MVRTAIIDSATLVNGSFKLKGTVDMPVEATLCLRRDGQRATVFKETAERRRLFLELGPVIITSTDSLANATIKGNQMTVEYQNSLLVGSPFWRSSRR